MISKKDLIHLTNTASDKVLKVLYDPLVETVYKLSKRDYTPCTDAALSILPLDYSHREITDANGMAFVITIEDGSFIIIDGGYGDYISNDRLKVQAMQKIFMNIFVNRTNLQTKKSKLLHG